MLLEFRVSARALTNQHSIRRRLHRRATTSGLIIAKCEVVYFNLLENERIFPK